MKRIASVAVLFASLSGPSDAHHSREMFDVTRNIALRGVVKAYHWQTRTAVLS